MYKQGAIAAFLKSPFWIKYVINEKNELSQIIKEVLQMKFEYWSIAN